MKDGREQQDDETFRDFLERLRAAGELVDLHQPVDIRHIATLVDQSDKALMFHDVIGYDMPVVSGIIRSQKRAIMSMGCTDYPQIESKLKAAIDAPVSPVRVETSSTLEVIQTGDDVDLYELPIPMSSVHDGGPMITAGIVISRDPEYGMNSGIYRFMVKERNLTGIDIVTPNNMRLFAQRAYEAGRPLPISISIGNHPYEIMGSGFRAPLGMDEMAIAGGIRGMPVALGAGQTIDVPHIAHSEIVLEAEILPTGWVHPRGPLRRVHPAHGRSALEPAGAGQVRAAPQGRRLLRAAHALGEHLARRAPRATPPSGRR
jgi:2,5-furandicarboxylate decarboxylase 1